MIATIPSGRPVFPRARTLLMALALALLAALGFAGRDGGLQAVDSSVPSLGLAEAGLHDPVPPDEPALLAAAVKPIRATESLPLALAPPMRAALDYIVQRHRVSAAALEPVFAAAQAVARERQLDPLLLIAVISIESGFNPFSQSPKGAQGLMQIIPRYHQDKVPHDAGEHPFLDPVTNVRMGAHILDEAIRRHGGLVEGLQFYNGARADAEPSYAGKVLAEQYRLEQAMRPGERT